MATNNGKKGGLLKGKLHYDKNGVPLGGIKGIVTDTNQPVELEGGEVIINKEASKKHWKELSKINQSAGNGVPILPPDEVDTNADEYGKGGNTKIIFNPNHIPNKWVYEYAKKIKDNFPKVWDLGGNQFGNQAFENLENVIKRGYWTENEEWMYIKWQSFNARHSNDFLIAGVIANLKWLNKVNKGWNYMKDLIEDKINDIYNEQLEYGGELKKGIEVEKEHLDTFEKLYNRDITPEQAPKYVTLEHLKHESPNYYSKLESIEKQFDLGGSIESEYKYNLRSRPFSIGTYPQNENFIRFEEDGTRFGCVVYLAPLTIEAMEKYELVPITDIIKYDGADMLWDDEYNAKISTLKNDRGTYYVQIVITHNGKVGKPFTESGVDFLKEVETGRYKFKGKTNVNIEEVEPLETIENEGLPLNKESTSFNEVNQGDNVQVYAYQSKNAGATHDGYIKVAEGLVTFKYGRHYLNIGNDKTKYDKGNIYYMNQSEQSKEQYNYNKPLQRTDVNLVETFKNSTDNNYKQQIIKFEYNGGFFAWQYNSSGNSGSITISKYENLNQLKNPLSTTGSDEIIYNTYNSKQITDEGKFLEFSISKWNKNDLFGKETENEQPKEKTFKERINVEKTAENYKDIRQSLDEFFTPKWTAEIMFDLAIKHGFMGGSVLEPSFGHGVFFDVAIENSNKTKIGIKEDNLYGFEIYKPNFDLVKKKYPKANLYDHNFEYQFIKQDIFFRKNNIQKSSMFNSKSFDLVIGNPPYGTHKSPHAFYFDKKMQVRYEGFFIWLALQKVKQGGLVIFIINSLWLQNGNLYNYQKEQIGKIGELIDAYRLPNKTFKDTDIATDIVVFRKK